MDLNATLLGEVLTFMVLVWFTVKFIWPPVVKAMNQRQLKIAEGLEATERAKRDLELAQQKIAEELREAKAKAAIIIDKAHEKGVLIVEQEVERARDEGERMRRVAKKEIEHEAARSKKQVRDESVGLGIMIAEEILKKEVDLEAQNVLLDKFIEEQSKDY